MTANMVVPTQLDLLEALPCCIACSSYITAPLFFKTGSLRLRYRRHLALNHYTGMSHSQNRPGYVGDILYLRTRRPGVFCSRTPESLAVSDAAYRSSCSASLRTSTPSRILDHPHTTIYLVTPWPRLLPYPAARLSSMTARMLERLWSGPGVCCCRSV